MLFTKHVSCIVSQLLVQLSMKIRIARLNLQYLKNSLSIVLFGNDNIYRYTALAVIAINYFYTNYQCKRTIHIDELCNVGYVINRDTFMETLINATMPAVLGLRKGFRNKAPKKNVELNAQVG